MRELRDLPDGEYELIRDCKYQRTFPSMNSNNIYTCCIRNLTPDEQRNFSVADINRCTDCVGSSCKHKERYNWSK